MFAELFFLGLAAIIVWFTLGFFSVLSDLIVVVGTVFITAYLVQFLAVALRKKVLGKVSPLGGKVVLVTGCDSGFGLAIAKRLDYVGFHVFAGCLSETSPGALGLKSSCSDRLQVIQMDITKEEEVQEAVTAVSKQLSGKVFWALVNNAGINNVVGETEWCTVKDIQKTSDVNTFGAVRVTLAFLPLLRKYKGRLITITSYTVWLLFPYFVPYGMSKWALHAFCDGLRMELKKWGIKVVTIQPWLYRTNIAGRTACLANLENIWSACNNEIKAVYGTKYSEALRKSVDFFTSLGEKDLSPVVDDTLDAILSREPHFSYKPSSFPFNILLYFQRYLPLWVMNCIIDCFLTREKPTACRLQK